MIDGLALDYAGTRVTARLAWRPDARLWQRLHAARDLRALLDTARGAAVGHYLSGLAATAGVEEIDTAFRLQFRARVAELAGWCPHAWRAAVHWCAHLIDLAAVAHLWTSTPLRWMQADPVLARYAGAAARDASRRAALVGGPLAPLGRALLAHAAAPPARRGGTAGRGGALAPLPVVLAAWRAHWHALQPRVCAEQRAALVRLEHDLLAHRHRFAQLPPADAVAARDRVAARALALLRADATQPVALFAYLVLLALDLERLRAECLGHAFDAATGSIAAGSTAARDRPSAALAQERAA